MLSGDVIAGLIISVLTLLGSGVAGWWQLRRINAEHRNNLKSLEVETESKIKGLEAEAERKREEAHLENERLIREGFAKEREESARKDKAIEQLTQDNARHVELRAVAETQADERSKHIIVLERQLGQTIDKAINEAKVATEERVKKDILEQEKKEWLAERNALHSARDADRERIIALEKEVAETKHEIETLRKQVEKLAQEKAELAARVNAA